MNKNYRSMLIAGIISLLASSGIFGVEVPKKDCAEGRNTISLRKAAGNYILSHFTLLGATPAASAAYIKLHTEGALKNSMMDFKTINRQLAKGVGKIIPVTFAGTCAYTTFQNNTSK